MSAARFDVTHGDALPSQREELAAIAQAERELASFVAWSEAVHHVVADHDAKSCLTCFSRES